MIIYTWIACGHNHGLRARVAIETEQGFINFTGITAATADNKLEIVGKGAPYAPDTTTVIAMDMDDL